MFSLLIASTAMISCTNACYTVTKGSVYCLAWALLLTRKDQFSQPDGFKSCNKGYVYKTEKAWAKWESQTMWAAWPMQTTSFENFHQFPWALLKNDNLQGKCPSSSSCCRNHPAEWGLSISVPPPKKPNLPKSATSLSALGWLPNSILFLLPHKKKT